MQIVLVGLNHKSAPVAVRERLAFGPDQATSSLRRLVDAGELAEAAIVSTCNRTEVYGAVDDGDLGTEAVIGFLCAFSGQPPEAVRPYLYQYTGAAAARHLARVAAGLDSMLIGEAQILGQVRAALRLSQEAGTAGPHVTRLFEAALRAGKRARAETAIGEGAASISHAAVKLAGRIFPALADKEVLLVGAGKVAELVARHLARKGSVRVRVTNRTRERALQLAAAYGWSELPMTNLAGGLLAADIVISSTGAPEPIIGVELVRPLLEQRAGRPLYFIDLAVPRDVDPAVQELPGAFVYNVDDLYAVVDTTLAERREQMAAAEAIVEEEVRQFWDWYGQRAVAPVIAVLRQRAEAIRAQELDKTLRRLDHLPEADKERIRALTAAIVNKLLHEPMVRLKQQAASPEGQRFADAAARLFGVEQELRPQAQRRLG